MNFYLNPQREKNQAITRERAYTIIKTACNDCGVYNVGTHTLRKRLACFYTNNRKNIGMLMDIFNHSSENITLRYIGITQEKIIML